MLQDITLRENGAVPGFVFVVDMKGTTLGHITKISLASLKKYYMYIQVWNSKYLARVAIIPFCYHGNGPYEQQTRGLCRVLLSTTKL